MLPINKRWLFGLGAALLLAACVDDDDLPCNDITNPDCPNYDVCAIIQPANSAFVILDSIVQGDTILSIPVDTNYGEFAFQYFRPEKIVAHATYEWKIGDDPRVFEGPIIELNFLSHRGTIPVRLITTIVDTNFCLTEEEKTDTSYQDLVLVDFEEEGLSQRILGTYWGSSTVNPSEEYEVDLFVASGPIPFLRFRGLLLDCSDVYDEEGIPWGDAGYDWFVTMHRDNRPRCRELTVLGKLRENDHRIIDIDYWFDDDNGVRQHEVFTGWRQ